MDLLNNNCLDLGLDVLLIWSNDPGISFAEIPEIEHQIEQVLNKTPIEVRESNYLRKFTDQRFGLERVH